MAEATDLLLEYMALRDSISSYFFFKNPPIWYGHTHTHTSHTNQFKERKHFAIASSHFFFLGSVTMLLSLRPYPYPYPYRPYESIQGKAALRKFALKSSRIRHSVAFSSAIRINSIQGSTSQVRTSSFSDPSLCHSLCVTLSLSLHCCWSTQKRVGLLKGVNLLSCQF